MLLPESLTDRDVDKFSVIIRDVAHERSIWDDRGASLSWSRTSQKLQELSETALPEPRLCIVCEKILTRSFAV